MIDTPIFDAAMRLAEQGQLECQKGNLHPSQFKIHPAMAELPAQDAYGRIVDLPISESSPLIALIPQALRDIAANLASQDGRMTRHPQYLTQKKRRQTGLDTDYCDDTIWIDQAGDCEEVTDSALIERLEELDAKGYLSKKEDEEFSDYLKTGYIDHWETLQPFFTEAAAQQFIDSIAHRHDPGTLRIYVESAYQNAEWQAIRNFLLSLNTFAPSAPAAP